MSNNKITQIVNEEFWYRLEKLRNLYSSKLKMKIEDERRREKGDLKQSELIACLLQCTPQNMRMECNLIFLHAVEMKLSTWFN